MFAQEYCDNTDFFVFAEEKRMAPTYAIPQKPHGKPKNGNCQRNGGKSTVMNAKVLNPPWRWLTTVVGSYLVDLDVVLGGKLLELRVCWHA